MKLTYFNERNLEHDIEKISARTEIFVIPVHRRFETDLSPSDIAGKLTAAFEFRELEQEERIIYQIRFLPLYFIAAAGADESGREHISSIRRNRKYAPRRAGYFDSFHLLISRDDRQVRFGPSGNILISRQELRGQGIGSYAFGELIRHAQARCPDFDVYPIEVSSVDARDAVSHRRRNHFYEKHGFSGSFSDEHALSGTYRCASVAALKISDLPADWEKMDLPGLLIDLFVVSDEYRIQAGELLENVRLRQYHGEMSERQLARIKKKNRALTLILAILIVCFYLFFRK